MAHRQDTVVLELENRCGGIVQAFFETLSPNEKELFKATRLAEQLLDEVELADRIHQDRSISRKVSQTMKPFLDGIDQYGKALDVLSNSGSLFLCPIWGSIRIVLHVATELREHFEKISSMLQQIGLHLNSLRRFPHLYPNNDRLAPAMVDVYRTIFRFCTEARDVFKKVSAKKIGQRANHMIGFQSGIKILWKPFKAQFGDLQVELSMAMDNVSKEVEIAEKEEAQAERIRAENERRLQATRWGDSEQTHRRLELFLDDQGLRDVNNWLDPVNSEVNHQAAVKVRHKGTGSWFLNGSAFQDWLNTNNSFLWLHAIPGAGKTILVSSAIELLKERVKGTNIGLAYYYCDYKIPETQEPSRLLCTLLAQVARQHRSISQKLQLFIERRSHEHLGSILTHDELQYNFASFLEGSFSQIILVVDAIDESSQRSCMMSDLKSILLECPFVKVLVSSREEFDITKAFKSFP